MTKSLYDEAIADAKKLREVAEKNAKNAIIEAVTPRIKQFIEDQLLEKDVSGDDSDVLESTISDIISETDVLSEPDDVVLSEDALSALLDLFGSSDDLDSAMNNIKSKSAIVSALNESLDTMDASAKERLLKIANKLKLEADKLIDSDIVMKENKNSNTLEENENMPKNSSDLLFEVDVDELVKSLSEAEHDGEVTEQDGPEEIEDGYDALPELDDDTLTEFDLLLKGFPDEYGEGDEEIDISGLSFELVDDDEEADVDLEMGEPEMGEPEMEEPEAEVEEEPGEEEAEEEAPLDEVFEVDLDMLRYELKNLSENLATKGKKNPMSHAFGGKPSDHPSGDDFGGGKRGKHPLQVKLNVLSEAYKRESRKNRALTNKLNEYGGAIESLREQLTEMNLFNAKLLYVNKLLQNKNMSGAQKRSIIEALDSADSLREVKLLYKSLTDSVRKARNGRTLSESAVRRSMGSASRAVSTSAPQNSQSGEVQRWAILAGIGKDA